MPMQLSKENKLQLKQSFHLYLYYLYMSDVEAKVNGVGDIYRVGL